MNILEADNNKLNRIDSVTLNDLESLKYLSLADNDISSIHNDAFKTAPLLKTINLSGNSVCEQPRLLPDLCQTTNCTIIC